MNIAARRGSAVAQQLCDAYFDTNKYQQCIYVTFIRTQYE